MKKEIITEALNLELNRSRIELGLPTNLLFVLQKNMDVHHSFGALKIFNFTLWLVKGPHKKIILAEQYTMKAVIGDEEKVEALLNIHLLQSIFKLLKSEDWEKIVKEEVPWSIQ